MAARKSFSAKPQGGSGKAGLAEDEAQGQALFEIANLRPERTGLPFVVFISQKGGARHDIRVKVAHGAKVRPSEMATVAVRPRVRVIRGAVDPDDLVRLTEWIELNRDVLVAYWKGDIEYTEDAIGALTQLPQFGFEDG
jgi:hypothetical protein